jgi:hypothetical protein
MLLFAVPKEASAKRLLGSSLTTVVRFMTPVAGAAISSDELKRSILPGYSLMFSSDLDESWTAWL